MGAERSSVVIGYVVVGVNVIWPRVEVLILTFAAFCAIQAVWQANAWADLRLARRLKATPRDTFRVDAPRARQ